MQSAPPAAPEARRLPPSWPALRRGTFASVLPFHVRSPALMHDVRCDCWVAYSAYCTLETVLSSCVCASFCIWTHLLSDVCVCSERGSSAALLSHNACACFAEVQRYNANVKWCVCVWSRHHNRHRIALKLPRKVHHHVCTPVFRVPIQGLHFVLSPCLFFVLPFHQYKAITRTKDAASKRKLSGYTHSCLFSSIEAYLDIDSEALFRSHELSQVHWETHCVVHKESRLTRDLHAHAHQYVWSQVVCDHEGICEAHSLVGTTYVYLWDKFISVFVTFWHRHLLLAHLKPWYCVVLKHQVLVLMVLCWVCVHAWVLSDATICNTQMFDQNSHGESKRRMDRFSRA